MSTIKEAVKLNAMLGDYPNTLAVKQGRVKSDLVQFDFLKFAEGEVPHDFFKRVVKGEFDFAELAIMTVLQAIGYGYPLVALPVAMNGRMQHGQIAYNAERGVLKPQDLPGKTVGVRTYSQTTPTWVRGILQNDFGVDLSKVNFIAQTDGHVPEFKEPANVRRGEKGKKLLQLLLDGEVDAAVLGADQDTRLKTLVPDPAAAGQAWHKKTGALMVNHIVVVKASLAKERPDVVREIYRLLKESKAAANEPAPKDGIDKRPLGMSAMRRNFEVAAEYAWQQRTVPKQLGIEDLLDATTRTLD
jgi:4,5-dihydroxyphthalate decarboxylase